MELICNEKQSGLALGSLFAVLHGAWGILVSQGLGQRFLDRLMNVHFVESNHVVTAFNGTSFMHGIIQAFVMGLVIGWLFAKFWNYWGSQKYFKI